MTVRVCNTGVWMELFLTASSFSPFMGSNFSFFHLPEVLAWHPLKSSLKGNWLKIPLWENNLFLSPWQKAEFCLYCGINIICLFALRSGSYSFPYDGFDHYLKWDFSSTLCSHLTSRAHSKDQIPHALLNPYLFFSSCVCTHTNGPPLMYITTQRKTVFCCLIPLYLPLTDPTVSAAVVSKEM